MRHRRRRSTEPRTGELRTIGVVTVGRSDYGCYLPILRRIAADPELKLHLIVSGMHLSPEFGLTVNAIEDDGFEIGERVEMLMSSDSPEGIAKSMGLGVVGFAQAFGRFRPDVVLVLGDRFEMHAAALASLPFKIPVAHIHGGEATEGAIDDALRHSLTKLSHLHFVATEEYARRVVQLGEEPWRVTICGAPALDNLQGLRPLSREELERKFGVSLEPAPLLVTFHPVTLEYERTERQVGELLGALEACGLPVVFTLPNADTGGRAALRLIEDFVKTIPKAQMVDNLGTEGYFGMMAAAQAMVGNSSSGIIGSRQRGRVRGKNVIDVGCNRAAIDAAIQKAVSPEFRAGLRGMDNLYDRGGAAERIVNRLKEVELDDSFLTKRFYEVGVDSE